MKMEANYISVFKIDGVPILPPLMTDAKRKQMQNYKELAIALETKLKLERATKEIPISPEKSTKETETIDQFLQQNDQKHHDDVESDDTGTIFENEYFKFSNLIKRAAAASVNENPHKNQSIKPSYLKNLKRSDLFICDIINNTLTIPNVEHQQVDFTTDNVGAPFTEKCSNCNVQGEDEKMIPIKINANEVNCSSKEKISKKTESYENTETLKLASKSSSTDVEIESSKSYVKIPVITIVPPSPQRQFKLEKRNTNLIRNCENIIRTPPKRSSTSTSLNKVENNGEIGVIRSNSFTLDSPSDALIEHIVKCKRDELQKCLFPATCDENKSTTISMSRKNSKTDTQQKNRLQRSQTDSKVGYLLNSNFILKSKKSPYDTKAPGKIKLIRKYKTTLGKQSSLASLKRKNSSSITNHNGQNAGDSVRKKHTQLISKPVDVTSNVVDDSKKITHIKELIEEIENKHRSKLKELLEKQQEEQKKMQENFERQQKLLLEKYTLNISNKNDSEQPTMITPISKSAWTDEINSNASSSFIQSPVSSPKYPANSNHKVSTLNSARSDNVDVNLTCGLSVTSDSPRKKIFPMTDNAQIITRQQFGYKNNSARKREKAATIINAYARGYLTRRLFKTELIRRTVDTIRETLIFVLELHMETEQETESEAVIRLKARLLQQLTSACYHLHKIFFEISIKERMEIIARDRKILKEKIRSSSKRSPRVQMA